MDINTWCRHHHTSWLLLYTGFYHNPCLLIFFFQDPWPAGQPSCYCPWVRIWSHFRSCFLQHSIHYQGHLSNLCSLKIFLFDAVRVWPNIPAICFWLAYHILSRPLHTPYGSAFASFGGCAGFSPMVIVLCWHFDFLIYSDQEICDKISFYVD